MKKAFALVLALVMLLTLAACGASKPAAETPSEAPAETPAEAPAETVYTIVIAETGSEETSNFAGHTAFKKYVEEASGGRLVCEIYCNSQLGSDRETLESTQVGSVTMMATGLTQVTNFIPELVGVDLPFYYRDTKQVLDIFTEPEFLSYLRELGANANYYVCGTAMQGFRTLTSSIEINELADCKGMDIRVIESATPMAIWTSLGANPTPLAFSEVYTALQQGVVDAQENPAELIYSQKFYEQQDYIIDTNHQIQPTFCVMNLDFYNSLPDDLKKICEEGFALWSEATQAYTDGNLAMYDQTFIDYGCTMIKLTDEARAEFVEATADVRADIAAQFPEVFAELEAAAARIG